MTQKTRADYENDKDFVLAMFEKACYGAYCLDVEDLEREYSEDGSITAVTVVFKKRAPVRVNVDGMHPFRAIAEIIKQAGLDE